MRRVRVRLGRFSRLSIESRFGGDVPAVTRAAARHYARGLDSDRRPVAPPIFARAGVPDREVGTEFDLLLPADVADPLALEAARRGVRLELIVAHAVLVFLADLDAATAFGRWGTEEAAATSRYRVDAQRPAPVLTRRRDRGSRPRARGGGRLSRR